MRHIAALLFLFLLLLPGAVNSIVAAELRTWTDSTGKHETKAEFVKLENDQVTLRKENGKTVTLPLTKLSSADQTVARELAAQPAASPASPRPKSNNVINSVRGAVYRTETINKMRQIMLAIINHESAMQRFPAAAMLTADKQPGLSWRVAILPFLEERALYEQFRLDEPWDSEQNRKLAERMPKIFESPGTGAEPGYTNYLAVRLPNSVIAAGPRGTRLRDIRDGTSKTVAIVEVDDDHAAIWTKPDDFEWSLSQPAKGLGNIWSGRFYAGFADARVMPIPMSTPAKDLQGLFTRDGGESVRLDSF